MKLFTLVLAGIAMLLSGCESMSSRVQDRFAGVPPQTRYFAADSKDVFDAGIKAVKSLQMNLGKSSKASGTIEAYNSIRSGDSVHYASQTSIQVRISPSDGGESKVELLVSESTEGNFPGGVSEQQLRAHSLYDLYFGTIQRHLMEAGLLKPVQ